MNVRAKVERLEKVVNGPGSAMARLDRLFATARRVASKAEQKGDLDSVMRANHQLERIVGSIGKILAVTPLRPSLLEGPEWLEIKAVVLKALEPHAEARREVVKAIDAGERLGARGGARRPARAN